MRIPIRIQRMHIQIQILIRLRVHTTKQLQTCKHLAAPSIAWHSRDHWIAVLLCYMLRGVDEQKFAMKTAKNAEEEEELNLFSVHFATSHYLLLVWYYILCFCLTLLSRPLVFRFIYCLRYPQENCFVPFRSFQLFLYTRIPPQTQQHLGFLVTPQISRHFFTLDECSS